MPAPSIVNQTPFTDRVFFTSSTTFTFDAAITAGNVIAVMVTARGDNGHNVEDVITSLSMTGVTWDALTVFDTPNFYSTKGSLIFLGTVDSGGATTLTFNVAAGNCYVVGRAFEIQDCAVAYEDKTMLAGTNNGVNTVTSSASGTLAVADSLVLAGSYANYTSTNIGWNTPSGYTAQGSQISGSAGNTPFAVFSKTLSATTSFTTTISSTQNDSFGRCITCVVLSGTVEVEGAGDQTIGAITQTAAGTVEVQGAGDQTIGALTQTAAGTVEVQGAGAQTIGAIAQTAAGTVEVQGAGAQTIGALTQTAAGTVAVQGAGDQTIGAITQTAAGTVEVTGAGAQTIGALTQTAEGEVSSADVSGAGDQTIGAITQTAEGEVTTPGPGPAPADASIGGPGGRRIPVVYATYRGRRYSGTALEVKAQIEAQAAIDAARAPDAPTKRKARTAAFKAGQSMRDLLEVEGVEFPGLTPTEVARAEYVMARELQRAYQQAYLQALVNERSMAER